jgi:hypothetical protein
MLSAVRRCGSMCNVIIISAIQLNDYKNYCQYAYSFLCFSLRQNA